MIVQVLWYKSGYLTCLVLSFFAIFIMTCEDYASILRSTQRRVLIVFRLIILVIGLMCGSAHATFIASTSPTGAGALSSDIPGFGGAVIDIVGKSGDRVLKYISAKDLYRGTVLATDLSTDSKGRVRGNAIQEIGALAFDQSMFDLLVGGIDQLAIRLTMWDGDNALLNGADSLKGEYQANENFLGINGVSLGSFSTVATKSFTRKGSHYVKQSGVTGFANDVTAVGWFSSKNILSAQSLDSVYQSILDTGKLALSFIVRGATPNQRNYISFQEKARTNVVDEPQGVLFILSMVVVCSLFIRNKIKMAKQR